MTDKDFDTDCWGDFDGRKIHRHSLAWFWNWLKVLLSRCLAATVWNYHRSRTGLPWTPGMRFSLTSWYRADSRLANRVQRGCLRHIGGCDKNMPGSYMIAIANIFQLFSYGGTIAPEILMAKTCGFCLWGDQMEPRYDLTEDVKRLECNLSWSWWR